MSLEVLIVGSGPIGLACGIEARRRGVSHLILEKGCLLQSLVNFPLTMTFFSTSDRLEIGGVPFVSHGPKPTRGEALEYYRRVASHWELRIRTYERVLRIGGEKGDFTVTSSRDSYRSRAIILATGFYDCPNMMGVPGEDLPKVSHYYREPYPYVGKRVLVVGAGNSAVDAALELYRRGAEVTLAARSGSLDEGVKYWIRPDMENRISEGSVRAFFRTEVKDIKEDMVVLTTPEGEVTVANDFVLALTGYHPDYEFLSSAGVRCSDDSLREPLHDAETFESDVPGLYLAGVLCNGMRTGRWLIENSRAHAAAILESIGL